jgi:hypothetical protein
LPGEGFLEFLYARRGRRTAEGGDLKIDAAETGTASEPVLSILDLMK